MGSYAIVLAPIAAILCADYYLVKGSKYNVPELLVNIFLPESSTLRGLTCWFATVTTLSEESTHTHGDATGELPLLSSLLLVPTCTFSADFFRLEDISHSLTLLTFFLSFNSPSNYIGLE